jgi:hypothetical protein
VTDGSFVPFTVDGSKGAGSAEFAGRNRGGLSKPGKVFRQISERKFIKTLKTRKTSPASLLAFEQGEDLAEERLAESGVTIKSRRHTLKLSKRRRTITGLNKKLCTR